MKFIKSVLAQDEAITASDVKTYDLPVNPLSHITFTLKALNVTDEATPAELLARLTKIEVLHRGSSILSMSGADLYAYNAITFGKMPIIANQIATDNATRYLTLLIPFGRKLMDPAECFPETKKGELKLRITLSSSEAACDGVIYQIETTELLGASPENYLKATTISKTPVVGENDVDLPIGNDILGVLFFGTTIVATTAWTCTIDKVKFLVDNVETNFSQTNWESMHGDLMSRIGQRQENDASADDDDIGHYALMDMDPNKDNVFAVESAGKSRVHLKITAGDTNALRAIPIELVKVGS